MGFATCVRCLCLSADRKWNAWRRSTAASFNHLVGQLSLISYPFVVVVVVLVVNGEIIKARKRRQQRNPISHLSAVDSAGRKFSWSDSLSFFFFYFSYSPLRLCSLSFIQLDIFFSFSFYRDKNPSSRTPYDFFLTRFSCLMIGLSLVSASERPGAPLSGTKRSLIPHAWKTRQVIQDGPPTTFAPRLVTQNFWLSCGA